MGREPHIVLLGDSVMMESVAESLASRGATGLLRTTRTGLADHFDLLSPDLILFELEQSLPDQVIELLRQQPGPVLVGLDMQSSQAIILGGYRRVVRNMDDLYQLVQAELRRQEGRPWGGVQDGLNWDT